VVVVNRDRFLLLVAAIASASCSEPQGSSGPPKSTTNVEIPAEPEPGSADDEPAVVEEADPAKSRLACDNEQGEVNCQRVASHEIGPSCEGLAGSCQLLANGGMGYKPRVAAAIAKCWERMGARICDIKVRETCNGEGIREVCPDRKFVAECQATLDRCKAARARVGYTLDECVQVMSALTDRERNWAIGAMGPAAEGCRLMFPVY
jgi:hypothetical protein